LYRQASRLEKRAKEQFDQVATTKATTIAGLIAQIEILLDDKVPIIIAGLRDLQGAIDAKALPPAPADEKILALFPEWITACRVAANTPGGDDSSPEIGPVSGGVRSRKRHPSAQAA
jgi:hypothetical protein